MTQITIGQLVDFLKLESDSFSHSDIVNVKFSDYSPYFCEAISILKQNLNCVKLLTLDEGFNDYHLWYVSELFNNLQYLRLNLPTSNRNNVISDDGLFLLLSRLSKLEALILSNIETVRFKRSFCALSSLQNLTSLVLECIEISKKEFNVVLSEIGSKLERLTVSNIRALPDATYFLQIVFLLCTKLKFLLFNFVESKVEDLVLFNIPTLAQLSLYLDKCVLNESSNKLVNVESLQLVLKNSTDAQIAHFLSFCPAIKCLALNATFTLEDSQQTLSALKNLIHLEKIEFLSCECLDTIIQIIISNPKCQISLRQELDIENSLKFFDLIYASEKSFEIVVEGSKSLDLPLPPNLK
ncbi:hypothetical protein B4U79_18983 [Dinothrombium tinctorium]|uniref:Uncharacterized protein n=1 Tax=Dinothrombium tinctorium TaxID=1965070 RepID=A0A3S3Q1M1_9ACAR|nr:hypothetical protein B4U79_19154 [Dinothrombium tinctorium]RWS01798.1 hypothetical protein B4U79_19152 [Dinothrombium tinctorium]RWS12187.1 hypothetical protein B4U79_18983 [Dinothrombium tinctorium]